MIKTKASNFKLGELNIPTIHGHTEIILKTKHGRVERVHSDNTFQSSVLANALRGLGEAANSPYNNAGFRNALPWTNLVGGLFLFRDQIQNSPSYMPAGNRMVGNGAYGVVNNSSPTELGSYNSVESESSSTNSKIVQVYDFTTTQAVGQINCVCLTSQVGGLMGYGNGSGDTLSSGSKAYYIMDNQSMSAVGKSLETDSMIIVGNMQYYFQLVEGILSVTKSSVAITQASIFDKINKDPITFTLSNIGNHLSLVSEALFVQADGTNIYIVPYKTQIIDAGGVAYFYKYDTTNDSLTEIALTNANTSSKTITPAYAHLSSIRMGCGFGNNIFAVRTSDGKMALFDLSNSGAFVTYLDITQSDGGNINMFGKLSPGLCYVTSSTNTLQDYIYDTSAGTCFISNCWLSANYRCYSYDTITDCIVTKARYNNAAFKNPLYLATINNLSRTVDKEASTTMKVIYSLEES